ncbi:MAG: PIG-L family deacetylase [Candidatus Aenigmarchaeota archaeon]|nr:PIG-L family deacetylase [Candidatus Aenigmarchaeota archaeon]
MFDLDDVKSAMAFGAHPDDEILGPGGTLHRLSEKGAEVYVVTFTCGATATNAPGRDQELADKRVEEAKKTDHILGVSKRMILDIPGQEVYNAVTGSNKLHHDLIRLIRTYRPQVLFTHSADNHRDHAAINMISSQSAFQASESILGHLGEPCPSPLILYYGVELDVPEPNIIIEIGPMDLDAKRDAMKAQLSQQRTDYLSRLLQNIDSRAKLYGARLGNGKLAEPFRIEYKSPLVVPY